MLRTRPQRRTLLPFAALTVALLVGVLTGCSTPTATASTTDDDQCTIGTSETLVVPVHAGAQAPSLPSQWECPITRAITAGVPINIVTAEGTPKVVLRDFRATLSTVNPDASHDDLLAAQNTVISAAKAATAASDGDNFLGALALASDVAGQNGPGGQVLTLDPGLSDTGVVRFTDPGMTTAAGEDIATLVTDHAQCPATMKGLSITFYGLGYGTDPQPRLSTRQVNTVTTAWLAVAKACGASATAVPAPRTGAGPTTTHTIKTVTPEADPTLTPAVTAAPAATGVPATCVTTIPDVSLGFLPDSGDFLDEATARAMIATAAAALGACHGHIDVVGTTSSAGTPAGRAQVSTARAEHVRSLLAQALHVDPATITARGVGYDPAAGCVPDRVNGALDPRLAQANRKTTITVHAA